MPYGEYNNGNSVVKWRQDEKSIHNKNIAQATAKGDLAYVVGTLRWADEDTSIDGDGKRVLKIPPQRILDNIPALQHVSERAQRVLADDSRQN